MFIECGNSTYRKLNESGIVKHILNKKEKIDDLLLTAYLDFSILYDFFDYSEKNLSNIHLDERASERERLYKDICKLKDFLKEENMFYDKEKVLMNNPCILGFLVLGEDVLNYDKYGFFDRLSLERAITSYCIGERLSISNYNWGYYFWRDGKFKNELSNSSHGDLSVAQSDVFENKYTNLFGFEINEGFKIDPIRSGFEANYSNWSSFLMTNLRYAEALGRQKMNEILNWKDVLKKVGSIGTATAEAMLGSNHDFTLDTLHNSFLMGTDPKEECSELLQIYAGENRYFFPYFFENKLIYLSEDKKGKIESPFKRGIFRNLRFSPILVYEESDLPHLLEGTYSLFARDRSILPEIMDLFITKIKKE